MSKRIQFNVFGTVQGVFFRDFTRQKANGYGITGFVKNDPDGKVSGEAQGNPDDLEKFVKDLHKGPRMAEVDKVDVRDIDTKDGESTFKA